MRLEYINETSLMLYVEQELDAESPQYLAQLRQHILSQCADFIVDITAAYTSLLITIHVHRSNVIDMHQHLSKALESFKSVTLTAQAQQTIKIPVYYGEEVALDADAIGEQTGLSFAECVQIHQQQRYHVYALGFAPGFAYLASLDERLHLPRLANPRKHVPAGSVAIAEQQTAVYPQASPGGWHIIGRSAQTFIDMTAADISLLHIGDQVMFYAVDKETFLAQGGSLA